MSEHYPRIRRSTSEEGGEPWLFLRESVRIAFYMRRSHQEVIQAVMRALEVYRRVVGPQTLGWYADAEGDWQELDDTGWERTRQELLNPRGANVHLLRASDDLSGYEFSYFGEQLDTLPPSRSQVGICGVAFWLPTEYLEEHGPGRVRELALELGRELPFNSGHAGLAFHFPEGLLGTTHALHDDCLRYPGLDVPEFSSATLFLGTRVKGVHWLNFLGQPVLGELGGATGLRARLCSPGTTVQEMEGERAVVTLGPWPEAGDLEQGRTLPAYRELARVLEPWLYERQACWSGFTEEDMRRWRRRFLD